jgi:hypothetical protein
MSKTEVTLDTSMNYSYIVAMPLAILLRRIDAAAPLTADDSPAAAAGLAR